METVRNRQKSEGDSDPFQAFCIRIAMNVYGQDCVDPDDPEFLSILKRTIGIVKARAQADKSSFNNRPLPGELASEYERSVTKIVKASIEDSWSGVSNATNDHTGLVKRIKHWLGELEQARSDEIQNRYIREKMTESNRNKRRMGR